MPLTEHISIRELMTQLEWDRPYSTQDLEAMGMPATNAARSAESGWLKRLGRGVYKVPNGTLDRDKVLAFLTSKLPGIHVGGKTALAWRGVRHNLAHRARRLSGYRIGFQRSLTPPISPRKSLMMSFLRALGCLHFPAVTREF
jgi:hypothetical protein